MFSRTSAYKPLNDPRTPSGSTTLTAASTLPASIKEDQISTSDDESPHYVRPAEGTHEAEALKKIECLKKNEKDYEESTCTPIDELQKKQLPLIKELAGLIPALKKDKTTTEKVTGGVKTALAMTAGAGAGTVVVVGGLKATIATGGIAGPVAVPVMVGGIMAIATPRELMRGINATPQRLALHAVLSVIAPKKYLDESTDLVSSWDLRTLGKKMKESTQTVIKKPELIEQEKNKRKIFAPVWQEMFKPEVMRQFKWERQKLLISEFKKNFQGGVEVADFKESIEALRKALPDIGYVEDGKSDQKTINKLREKTANFLNDIEAKLNAGQ